MKTRNPFGLGMMFGGVLTLSCLALAGCPKKETPGPEPTPVPTAIVIPTPQPGTDATCARPYSFTAGGQIFFTCFDAIGDKVECPANPENLPKCVE